MQKFNEHAYKIAWDWFRVHADQRMDLFRFYVAISAAVAAGFGGAVQIRTYALAATIAGVGCFVVPVFAMLDRRVGTLLKLGEAVLKREQSALENEVEYDDIKIAQKADDAAMSQLSFTKLFKCMYFVFFVLFLSGVAYAIGLECSANE